MYSFEVSKYILLYLSQFEWVKGAKRAFKLLFKLEQEKAKQQEGIDNLIDNGNIYYKLTDDKLKIKLFEETAPLGSCDNVDKNVKELTLFKVDSADLFSKGERVFKIAEFKQTFYGLFAKPNQEIYKIELDVDNETATTEKIINKVLKNGNIAEERKVFVKKVNKEYFLNYMEMFNFSKNKNEEKTK